MASVKELRLRITSVGNIQQITRAMEMVATTKLRRFQDRAIASRPYTEEIAGLVSHLAGVLGEEIQDNPLFKRGAGSKTAVLLVSSDRGLCGAYNSNLFASVEEWMTDREKDEVDFFVYGKKGYSYLTGRGYNVERFLVEPPLESIDFGNAARTAQTLVETFLSGDYADVHVYYTAFQSMVRYDPTTFQLLPLEAGEGEEESAGGDLILEPDAETIFDSLIPRYLEVRVYNALLEALTSEYASRRMSMKNATDAASDMIKMLKGRYNRLRQENITKDLLDIVGGAEALR
jgi:F-type H+-transporting ATPase subunit gamma